MRIHHFLLLSLATTACGSTPPAPAAEPADPEPSAGVAQVAADEPTPAPTPVADEAPAPSEAPAAEPPGEAEPAQAQQAEPAADKGAAQPAKAAKASSPAKVTAAPAAPAPPPAQVPAPKAKPVVGTFRVASGSKATFLIDAPLEKIKGRWSKAGGTLTVDPSDLTKTRGSVTIDLLTLKTQTFGDPDKDGRQGEHARNWMEVGTEVSASTREKYRMARFTIERIDSAQPNQAGVTARVKASGKLELHGHTVDKTVELDVSFEGPAGAPTAMKIDTVKPLSVSLKGHDIKPRDLAGRFLSGALDKIGQKIADRVNVSLHLTATRQ